MEDNNKGRMLPWPPLPSNSVIVPAWVIFLNEPASPFPGTEDAAQAATHIRTIVRDLGGEKYLYYPGSPNWNDAWDILQFKKRVQIGDGPRERWTAAFEAAFEEGHSPVMLIAGPFDAHSPELLKEAMEALNGHDVVVASTKGVATCLLGMHAFQRELLTNWPDHIGDVIQYLEQALPARGLSCRLLTAALKPPEGL